MKLTWPGGQTTLDRKFTCDHQHKVGYAGAVEAAVGSKVTPASQTGTGDAGAPDPQMTLAALIAALREHVKACGASHSQDGSCSSSAPQPLSLSRVVLPLMPLLASLGPASPASNGRGLELAALKVSFCGCAKLACMSCADAGSRSFVHVRHVANAQLRCTVTYHIQ